METQTPDPRYYKLSRDHHHFVYVPDPWHFNQLLQIPQFKEAFDEGRVIQGAENARLIGGPPNRIWYSADEKGNLIGEWGCDMPASVPVCPRCKSVNFTGAPAFCAYCGGQYA